MSTTTETTNAASSFSAGPCGGEANIVSKTVTGTRPMASPLSIMSSGLTYFGMLFILPFSLGFWFILYYVFKNVIAVKIGMYVLLAVLLANIGNQIYEIVKLYEKPYDTTKYTCKDGSVTVSADALTKETNFVYSYTVILVSLFMSFLTFRAARSMTPGVNNRAQSINQNKPGL